MLLDPGVRPVMVVDGELGLVIVPVPDTRLQVAVSFVKPGAVADRTVLVLLSQNTWLPDEAPVTDCVGAATVIVISEAPFTQGPDTVHLNR